MSSTDKPDASALTKGISGRVVALDGLRGMAALAVVITHLICVVAPGLYLGVVGHPGYQWQDTIAKSPLFLLYSGQCAVFIFFVLSGYVLSASVHRSKANIIVLSIRRYIRLMVPILASLLFAFLLLRLGPHITQKLAAESPYKSWGSQYVFLGTVYRFGPFDIQTVLRDASYNICLRGGSYYNLPLWTMQVELWGSLLVYLFHRCTVPRWRPILMIAATVGLLYSPFGWWKNLMPFATGALLFEVALAGYRRSEILGFVVFVLGLYLGGAPRAGTDGSLLEGLAHQVAKVGSPYFIIGTVGATCIVAGTLMWSGARWLFERRIPRFLGRISFALYLVHFPVLGILFAGVYYKLNQPARWTAGPIALVISIAFYLITTLICAMLLTWLVDEPLLKALAWKQKPKVAKVVMEAEPVLADVSVVGTT